MPPLVLWFVLTADLLGPPIHQDGLSLRPPREFHLARMDLFHGTRVIGIASKEGSARYLSAALMDGDGEDAAAMLVSVLEIPLRIGPNARDEAATAVTKHVRDELGLQFNLERADVVGGNAPRIEVRGQVREGAQLRKILVAAFVGRGRHAVVLASVPSGKWEQLLPGLNESLDSMKIDQRAEGARPLALAMAVVVGAALLASFGLWRRRLRRLTREPEDAAS